MSIGTLQPPVLTVGRIKTFGAFGPKYEIVGTGRPSENGDWLIPIKVIESGEELDYRYSRLALDPDAI
jgi:hypothetical protein